MENKQTKPPVQQEEKKQAIPSKLDSIIRDIRNNAVTTLNLWYNSIEAEGARAIADALKSNSSVTTLHLGLNNIGDEGARAIVDALKSNSSVTSLDLGGNNIGDEGARAIADALKSNSSVTSLDLGGNNIGDEGARAIADALKSNSSLTSLSLYINNIGDEGARAIADVLKSNSSVTTLNLWYNSIEAEGARAIADALKSNSSVTTLHLGLNNIGDEGARAIADALKSNSSVTSLNLYNNNIGAEGARAIADTLKSNSSVTSLDLGENSIGAEGARAIADALKSNSSVTSLDLQASNIGAEALVAIKTQIDRIKAIPDKQKQAAKQAWIQKVARGKGEENKEAEQKEKEEQDRLARETEQKQKAESDRIAKEKADREAREKAAQQREAALAAERERAAREQRIKEEADKKTAEERRVKEQRAKEEAERKRLEDIRKQEAIEDKRRADEAEAKRIAAAKAAKDKADCEKAELERLARIEREQKAAREKAARTEEARIKTEEACKLLSSNDIKDLESSVKLFERADQITADEKFGLGGSNLQKEALLGAAKALHKLGRLDNALVAVDKLLEIDGSHPEGIRLKGAIEVVIFTQAGIRLYDEARFDQAIQTFDQAINATKVAFGQDEKNNEDVVNNKVVANLYIYQARSYFALKDLEQGLRKLRYINEFDQTVIDEVINKARQAGYFDELVSNLKLCAIGCPDMQDYVATCANKLNCLYEVLLASAREGIISNELLVAVQRGGYLLDIAFTLASEGVVVPNKIVERIDFAVLIDSRTVFIKVLELGNGDFINQMFATGYDFGNTVTALVKKGETANLQLVAKYRPALLNIDDSTLLQLAVNNGHLDTAEFLLAVNKNSSNFYPYLKEFVESDQKSLAQKILELQPALILKSFNDMPFGHYIVGQDRVSLLEDLLGSEFREQLLGIKNKQGDDLIYFALRCGKIAAAELLLKTGIDSGNLIKRALDKKDLELIKNLAAAFEKIVHLINANAVELGAKGELSNTYLSYKQDIEYYKNDLFKLAADKKLANLLSILVELNIDLTDSVIELVTKAAKDDYKKLEIVFFAKEALTTVMVLSDNGYADNYIKEIGGLTLLQLALYLGKYRVAEQILKSNKDTLEQLAPNKLSTMQLFLGWPDDDQWVKGAKLLAKYGADFSLEFENAIRYRQSEVVFKILKVKPELVNSNFEDLPLGHFVVKYGATELLEKLIQRYGLKVINSNDKHGDSLLYFSLEHGNLSATDLLLKHGAKIKPEIDKALARADINVLRNIALVAIEEFAEAEYLDATKMLLRDDNILKITDKAGNSLLHFAADRGNIELIKACLQNSQKLKSAIAKQNTKGQTIWHVLLNSHIDATVKTEMVSILLKYSNLTDIRILAKDGYSAFDIAMDFDRQIFDMFATKFGLDDLFEKSYGYEDEPSDARDDIGNFRLGDKKQNKGFELEDEKKEMASEISGKPAIKTVHELVNKLDSAAMAFGNLSGEEVNQSVVLLGYTRSGKSTLANYLAGNRMIAMSQGEDDDGNKVLGIDIENHPDSPIGHEHIAKTTLPNRYVADDIRGDIVYWDCPGFGDNRGAGQDILNAYMIQKLFSMPNLKLALVVRYGELKPSGRLVEITKILGDMVSNISMLQPALSLIVTQGGEKGNPAKVVTQINQIINSGIDLSNNQREILEYLATHVEKIAVFHKPKKEGIIDNIDKEAILSVLANSSLIAANTLEVSHPVSPSTKEYIRELYKPVIEKVSDELKNLIATHEHKDFTLIEALSDLAIELNWHKLIYQNMYVNILSSLKTVDPEINPRIKGLPLQQGVLGQLAEGSSIIRLLDYLKLFKKIDSDSENALQTRNWELLIEEYATKLISNINGIIGKILTTSSEGNHESKNILLELVKDEVLRDLIPEACDYILKSTAPAIKLLHYACYKGDLDAVKILLTSNEVRSGLNDKDALGNTPLHMATLSGNAELVAYICEGFNSQVDMNLSGRFGRQLIHEVTNTKVLEYLVRFSKHYPEKYRLDINSKDIKGHTILYYASRLADESVLKYLFTLDKEEPVTYSFNMDDNSNSFNIVTATANDQVKRYLLEEQRDRFNMDEIDQAIKSLSVGVTNNRRASVEERKILEEQLKQAINMMSNLANKDDVKHAEKIVAEAVAKGVGKDEMHVVIEELEKLGTKQSYLEYDVSVHASALGNMQDEMDQMQHVLSPYSSGNDEKDYESPLSGHSNDGGF